MNETNNHNQTVTALDIVSGTGELAQRAALSPRIESIESPDGIKGQFAVVPTVEAGGRASVRLESVEKFYDEYRTKPVRRKGTAILGDLDSLIAHVNRFKDADSVVFANTDRKKPAITAVLDYHRAGSTADPRFGGHRSHYAFPVSDEWLAWTEKSGDEMTQANFAEFIESHIVDVVESSPEFKSAEIFAEKCGVTFATPAQIMELSRGLSINVESKVAGAVNLQNGVKQISFTESHTGENGAPLKVPGAFLIGIPVFRGEAGYQVCVRLRYRKQGASLSWIMDLWRHQEVFDAAIRGACDKVADATELPLLVGTPE
jgi:uncharacterized protein YfdQ (DUF2303 family)